ncbi:concanavalin A-like lectin/glucanase domain-containing protein [Lineolata rhizophorae]|uniref:endo-1,3(4)-beta-glucanase n=1 Tax=Lineolata rhizophorae TaxID=578093 RepID=A0A6A6P7Y7_9PEZI|nr:concanavalin A-like lectin/glucanase domain-containing protein [Lineolata rhizophorae]
MATAALFVAVLALVNYSAAGGFVLSDDYNPSNFFDKFNFYTGQDPTHGFVDYIDQSSAHDGGLIDASSGQIYMGVDHVNMAPNGRQSVRLESKTRYNSGLIILDLAHMPGGICGTWPAFWTVGDNWPNNGEIDIIEGVHDQSANKMTLHTGPGCAISANGGFSGSVGTTNCDVNAAGQGANEGCQISDSNSNTYGSGFNSNNGGVYATLWDSDAISMYFFPRGAIPGDISSGDPDPSSWGSPKAKFSGFCDISRTFRDHRIIFDTTFCGDWAGATWGNTACAARAGTCNDFVRDNPAAFQDAYWSINSLKVYQQQGAKRDNSSSLSPTGLSTLVTAPVATAPVSTTFSTPTPSAPAVKRSAPNDMTHMLPAKRFEPGSAGRMFEARRIEAVAH